MNNNGQLRSKLMNYANVLRDDGLSYGDYLEQITYLLFLKIDWEKREIANQLGKFYESLIPRRLNWQSLVEKDGGELEQHYRRLLKELGVGSTIVAIIFRRAQNMIQDPAKLKRLVDLIDAENWSGTDIDVKSDVYEELLEMFARDTRSGAGQYFTPRPLIQAIVEVMRPTIDDTINDPACGTGGFLLAGYDYIQRNSTLDRDEHWQLRHRTISGTEIVPDAARLCVMNLYLHNIGTDSERSPIRVGDSLIADPGERYSMVLTNPPFGKKSSVTIVGEDGSLQKERQEITRDDFWTTTSNKQLNFVQHISTILDINGRAAVVVPDNVLFEGGAGETVRRRLLHNMDVHTILRLPTGIFYAQGVKANVIFFDKRPIGPNPNTREIWFYDMRTNMKFTLKQNPLRYTDLEEFIECYNPDNRHKRTETWSDDNPDGRWRVYSYDDIMARDKVSLDIFWLRDESLEDNANLPDPEIIAAEILEDLQAALEQFAEIAEELGLDE